MVNKFKSARDRRWKGSAEEKGDAFFAIALSATVLAFFVGISLAFLEPHDVHSQAIEKKSRPTNLDDSPIYLKREFIYLGSRLIAIDEAGAGASKPAEPIVWSPRTGLWRGIGESEGSPLSIQFGEGAQEAFLADLDGDGRDDRIVLERESGTWSVMNSFGMVKRKFRFGSPGDVFSIGDFDGDGRADISAFESGSGVWSIRYSADERVDRIEFGTRGDKPCLGDFDADGRTDLAVWRDEQSKLLIRHSSDSKTTTVSMPGDFGEPSCADFDGDGRADVTLRRGNSWTIRSSRTGLEKKVTLSDSRGEAVIADYDGDGKADLATWDSESGFWEIMTSGTNTVRRFKHGRFGERAVAGVMWR